MSCCAITPDHTSASAYRRSRSGSAWIRLGTFISTGSEPFEDGRSGGDEAMESIDYEAVQIEEQGGAFNGWDDRCKGILCNLQYVDVPVGLPVPIITQAPDLTFRNEGHLELICS